MIRPDILFEDKDIIVAVKPAGMLSQGDRSSDMDMVSYLKNLYNSGKSEPYISLINRLDRPVGGIMVFARNKTAAAALSRQVQAEGKGPKMDKSYIAVLTGILPEKQGILRDYLIKDSKTNLSRVCDKDTKGAKEAILEYKVLRTKFEDGVRYSYVKIHLITGRHHQIRVQTANAGAGIFGDTKYNPMCNDMKGKPLKLFAAELSFMHPTTKKKLSFTPDPPAGIEMP